MARDTLPRGASLLALAGSTVARTQNTAPMPRLEAPTAPRPVPSEPLESTTSTVAQAARPASLPLGSDRKQKVNARISAPLLEEVRDCVVALSGPPHGMTMDQFAEEAYRRELDRLKRKHAAAKEFPRRPYNPRPGRRVA